MKDIAWVIAGILIPASIVGLLICFQLGVPTETSRWVHLVYTKKIAYANSITRPKIIFASGSNTLFGIRCDRIEQEVGVPTVNLGTHGGLGLEYLLYKAKNVAKSGDVVILPLEYLHYYYDGKPFAFTMDVAMSRDIGFIPAMVKNDPRNIMVLVSGWERILKGIRYRYLPQPTVKDQYSPDTLTINGDETNNVGTGFSYSLPGDKFQNQPSAASVRILTKFINWCRKEGVYVYAAYPVLCYHQSFNSVETAAALYNIETMWKKLGIPILGNPYDSIYDEGLFFDTVYHLNNIGAQLNTGRWINIIKYEVLPATKLIIEKNDIKN